jgi:hypothetical protein
LYFHPAKKNKEFDLNAALCSSRQLFEDNAQHGQLELTEILQTAR